MKGRGIRGEGRASMEEWGEGGRRRGREEAGGTGGRRLGGGGERGGRVAEAEA